MTKFDIRLRRNQFTRSRIERHKNFQNLMGNYDKSSRKKTRGIMVLAILMILIIAILLAFFGTLEEPKKDAPKNNADQKVEVSKIGNHGNKTVYKL